MSTATLKAEVEGLWAALIGESNEKKKEALRARYREAYRVYRTQLTMNDPVPYEPEPSKSHESTSPVPRTERPEVYDYQDYRALLLAWFGFLKTRHNQSIEAICLLAGVTVSDLSEVFQGRRKLTRVELQRLLPHLKLTGDEMTFLEQLRSLADAETAEERVAAADRVQEFADFKKRNPGVGEAWRYLTHWYYVAIRELSTLGGFRANVTWIRERLRGSVLDSEIRRALEFLEGAGFFRRSTEPGASRDQVFPLVKEISCVGGVYKVALGQLHREMLSMASSAIHELPSEKRWISGRTVALSKENYQRAVEILSDALGRIGELEAAESVVDDVYHIGLFAVPLTRSDAPPG
jgi:uncharacterized protein (TIGR02147 family)